MYQSYPHDTHAQLEDTSARAIEGDQYHLRIQRGTITLSLTANTQLNQAVSFSPAFTPSTTPDIWLQPMSVGSISAKLNYVTANEANTGFTIQAYSDTTQTVKFRWLAVCKAE